MTFEELLGLVSHVFHVPLGDVFDLPLSTIVVYASLMPSIIRTTSPFGSGEEEEEQMTLDDLRRMLA